MNSKFFGLILISASVSAVAANGSLIAEIDSHKIDLEVECEDTLIMLNSFSDFEVNGKSDSDGDGIYLTLGGIPSMNFILGVFNIQGEEYKFKHKTNFTLKELVIPETDVMRKDGSTYRIKLELACS